MLLLPSRHSFKVAWREAPPHEVPQPEGIVIEGVPAEAAEVTVVGATDENKRLFLKALGGVGLGVLGVSLLPSRADALVMGGTPSTSVMGVKDATNTRVNPAIKEGTSVLKKTLSLTSSGTVHTPGSGKRIRVYNNRFSLSADMTSVSFRFTAGGSDYEKYLTPKAGGLYGANNQPNYVQGGVDEVLYCSISGTGTVQINLDYVEV
jgi:hypothetical protein